MDKIGSWHHHAEPRLERMYKRRLIPKMVTHPKSHTHYPWTSQNGSQSLLTYISLSSSQLMLRSRPRCTYSYPFFSVVYPFSHARYTRTKISCMAQYNKQFYSKKNNALNNKKQKLDIVNSVASLQPTTTTARDNPHNSIQHKQQPPSLPTTTPSNHSSTHQLPPVHPPGHPLFTLPPIPTPSQTTIKTQTDYPVLLTRQHFHRFMVI